jgi:hypothetical protein
LQELVQRALANIERYSGTLGPDNRVKLYDAVRLMQDIADGGHVRDPAWALRWFRNWESNLTLATATLHQERDDITRCGVLLGTACEVQLNDRHMFYIRAPQTCLV